jgi:hypothetical protein
MKMRSILHPSDFSSASRAAFARAVAMATTKRVVGTAPGPVLTVRGK